MPDGLTFVAGSVNKNATTGHIVNGDVKNSELRLVMASVSLEPLPEGELMSFKVKLGNKPGDFRLSPTVIASNGAGERLDWSATPGTVRVLSPYIELSPKSIDFGRQPIRGTYSRSFSIRNSGNEPLTVEAIEPSATEFSVVTPLPITVAAGNTETVNFNYAPMTRASSVAETLTVRSNAVNDNSISGDNVLSLTAVPFSVNELHVAERVSGNSDENVTVKLRLNNMEPIMGIQAQFKLPDALVFVEGSLQGIGRGVNLTTTGMVKDNNLTLLAYAMDGYALQEANDVVLQFELRLSGRSGSYWLNPSDVLLSSAEGENMTSATSGQYVQINAPAISVPTSLDFGNVAVGSEGTFTLNIYNSGQAPLNVERIEFDNETFCTEEPLPFSVASSVTKPITLKFAPTKEGQHFSNVSIYSNDPENRLKTVTIKGDAFESNQIRLSGEPNDDYTEYTLHVALDNYTEITALQMDVNWIEGMTTSQSDLVLESRASGHSYSVAAMGNGIYRIIIFSFSNAPFAGNDGELFSLTFHGTDFTGTVLSAENIVLSSASGQNYTSPGPSITVVSVEDVKVSAIEISAVELEMKAPEKETLTATVVPSNAAIKTVTWSSSNPTVAEISDDGEITALSVGETTITATADDDSGVTTQCKVTVVPTPVEMIELSDNEVSLKVGESHTLTATVKPETATNKELKWESSSSQIAFVDQNGQVTALEVGVADITVTSADDSQVSAVCHITVEKADVAALGIKITTKGPVNLEIEDELQLTAEIYPEDADDKTINWDSSDRTIANVDDTGLVTAIGYGLAIITASDAYGHSDQIEVNVDESTGINNIINEGKLDVFDVNGLTLKENAVKADLFDLTPGLYIIRQGSTTLKLKVK